VYFPVILVHPIYSYVGIYGYLLCVSHFLINMYNRMNEYSINKQETYRGADKSLAWPTSNCILFDGENISFDGSI
jgi:hypothetical protein